MRDVETMLKPGVRPEGRKLLLSGSSITVRDDGSAGRRRDLGLVVPDLASESRLTVADPIIVNVASVMIFGSEICIHRRANSRKCIGTLSRYPTAS